MGEEDALERGERISHGLLSCSWTRRAYKACKGKSGRSEEGSTQKCTQKHAGVIAP